MQIETPNLNNYSEVKKQFLASDWFHKDIIQDSFPGTSLFRVYNERLKNIKGQEVIVAILDMSVDINHTYLQDHIWTNVKEIAGNNIDDDANGYIDDIHGWNFLGNQQGENLSYEQFEFTRIIKRYRRTISVLNPSDSLILQRANKAYISHTKYISERSENINTVILNRKNAYHYLDSIFKGKEFKVKDLDSLKKVHPKDSILQLEVLKMTNFINYNFTPKRNDSLKKHYENYKNIMLNENYPERDIIGDSLLHKLNNRYGNNNVSVSPNFLNHGTLVSGMLTTKYINTDSINVFKNIKIMPLRISAYGDEYDKDIALAIRYAVDNGARVINMSFGKLFSIDKHWVDEAIKYAEDKGVLIVKSAGNERSNTDKEENTKYPNDYNDGIEFSNNVITVGGTSHKLNEKLLYYSTNYGEETVDIFAPGQHITTLYPHNGIVYGRNGTSYATPIVSGISALLFSHYPNLDASDVKKILLESGLSFNHLVNLPKNRGEETVQKPFNELSKSGKLINAYNAFLYAAKYQKNKH
ncbi:S8 family serine peptidase [uncultured Dokdonia sp.]|uniref:S8 family serine peptidase n=1 Tax=uncultured Dokdonia sp. TaxID=575653 RepID=UPI002615354C|nr:S8 family serine peptidase [uncultured Dokdonia sp.]